MKKNSGKDIHLSIMSFIFALVLLAIFALFVQAIGSVIIKCIWKVEFSYVTYYIFTLIIALLSFIFNKFNKLKDNYQLKEKNIEFEFNKKREELEREYLHKDKEIQNRITELDESKRKMETLMQVHKPFSFSASLYADMKTYIFDAKAEYLKYKKNPAIGTAEIIKKDLKKRTKEAELRYAEMRYKYEFLLDIFPELKSYVEDEEDLQSLSYVKDFNEFQENHDRTKDYLTDEEWNSLNNIQRNQLAFERWKASNKSNHMIGMLYEMYISEELRKRGYSVIEYGIKHGLSDLGRDIIAHKDTTTLIIQCKNWSKNKMIHENVITQLYGTTFEYSLSHPTEIVKAMLICTTNLSPIAKEFATRLNIEVKIAPMGAFPMIKCNINGIEKIYHLPFDQQYERTLIKNPGEFYAWTIEEAENAGFRRAMKHFF